MWKKIGFIIHISAVVQRHLKKSSASFMMEYKGMCRFQAPSNERNKQT